VRKTKCLGSLVVALLSLLAAASPASPAPGDTATTSATVKSVTIQGDPVVGVTLEAVVDVRGAPAPTVRYQWARCGAAASTECTTLAGATSATYTVVEADLGSRLVVRVTAKNSGGPTDHLGSAPTVVVTAAPPPDPPPPNPPPSNPPPPPKPPPPSPPPSSNPPPAAPQAAPQSSPVVTPAPTSPPASVAPTSQNVAPATTPLTPDLSSLYLNPFPVVRIKGASVAGGAIIQLLRVTAPRRAAVNVRCVGARCPLRRLSVRTGRIRALERFLPAGLAITIRVTRAGYIGKYVRFIVRSHAAPERRDACLLPGSTRPRDCPA
jgi:hypothetical protein